MPQPSVAFPHLAAPWSLGGLTLGNRLVMAPMSTSLGGKDGAVTPENIAFYRERVLGGFALIIVEFTCVEAATGRSEEHQLILESRRMLDGHLRLVESIHAAGGKAFLQLQHGGRFANVRFLPDGIVRGPSPVFSRRDPSRQIVEPFRSGDIDRLVDAFGRAAGLAAEAGYDGIEVHAAHGYLLSQFLSPLSNLRDDAWGGDAERRLAFPHAVARAVKQAIGGRPLCFRISADEFVPGGLGIDDMVEITPRLVSAGVDMLHASIGRGPEAFDKVMEPMSTPEGWRLPYARKLREAAGVPVIGVGQIRWPAMAEAAIAAGDCDLIALGRPSLADPAWPNKALAGRVDEIRPCTSCNWCIAPGREPVGCAENPRAGRELDRPIPPDAGRGRCAVVIGGGPGGLAAALMLDQAGFETHLFEARGSVGGGLIASATPPGKDKLHWYRDYLERRLACSGVRLHLGRAVEADEVVAYRPAIAVVAAGTRSRALPIEGLDAPMVREAYALLMGDAEMRITAGDRVIVYGGGETGCEAAEYCAERGASVLLVTRSRIDQLARSAEPVYRHGLMQRLLANTAIEIVAETHIRRVDQGGATLLLADGTARTVEAAHLLLAQGRDPDPHCADILIAAGIRCHVVGDSRTSGRIGDAVHAAYAAVRATLAAEAEAGGLAC
ncbi:oxidoreductase [Flavisphingomonas formosensis]|uniref:oxidoreductase n=1 Tax=Flavisphingomonas formosensis TaxID=861534 RepID=UPI001E535A12|nr:FAD-dependent oxidoreductase [Sphingomonas formosensis]